MGSTIPLNLGRWTEVSGVVAYGRKTLKKHKEKKGKTGRKEGEPLMFIPKKYYFNRVPMVSLK